MLKNAFKIWSRERKKKAFFMEKQKMNLLKSDENLLIQFHKSLKLVVSNTKLPLL